MGSEVKDSASPYTELKQAIKDNGEHLAIISGQLSAKQETDSKWRESWAMEKRERKLLALENAKHRRNSTRLSFGALTLTATAFFLNVFKFNEESQFLQSLSTLLEFLSSMVY